MFAQLMWTDYVLLIIILGSSLLSIRRGFIRELISILTWSIAIFVSFKYSGEIGKFINTIAGADTVSPSIAMTGTFIASLLLLSKIGYRLARKLKYKNTGIFDKLLGILFGFGRGLLITVVIIALSLFTPFMKDTKWLQTPVAATIKPISDSLESYIPDNVEKIMKQQVSDLNESDFVQQTKKLLNALFGLQLDVKDKTDEEKKNEQQQQQVIDQKQQELNKDIQSTDPNAAVTGVSSGKPVDNKLSNPLFKEAARKAQMKTDERSILLQKQKEIELQRQQAEEQFKFKLKLEQEKQRQQQLQQDQQNQQKAP